MDYALVENGIVVNIIRLSDKNAHKFPNAVKMNNISVGIDDSYIDGVFYRNGIELLPEEVYAYEQSISLEEMDAAYREGVNSV